MDALLARLSDRHVEQPRNAGELRRFLAEGEDSLTKVRRSRMRQAHARMQRAWRGSLCGRAACLLWGASVCACAGDLGVALLAPDPARSRANVHVRALTGGAAE